MGSISQKSYESGAFAIIFNDKKEVLLALRDDIPMWNLPGGSLDKGESEQRAVVRETGEEIGCYIEIKHLSGIYTSHRRRDYTFVCSIMSGIPIPLDETVKVDYFSLDALPKNLSETHRNRILDAVRKNLPIERIETEKRTKRTFSDLSHQDIHEFDYWLNCSQALKNGSLKCPIDHLLVRETQRA